MYSELGLVCVTPMKDSNDCRSKRCSILRAKESKESMYAIEDEVKCVCVCAFA